MGFAIPFPSPNDTCAKQAIYIAAGPATSLLLAVVIGISMRLMVLGQQNPPWQVTALCLISTFLFLGSIIPCTSKHEKGLNSQKPLQNDGAMLVELWRERRAWAAYYAQCEEYKARGTTYDAELARYNEELTLYQAEQEAYQAELATYHAEIARYEAVNALYACAEAGMRPLDWDEVTVERATILRDGKVNELTACYYGYYWAEDRDDPETSGRYISRALELRGLLVGAYQAKVLLDGAYYAGFRQGDSNVCRRLIAKAAVFPIADDSEQAIIRRAMVLRAEAAALFAEGEIGEARTKAQDGLLALADLSRIKDCSDRCLLERLIAACASPCNKMSIVHIQH